MNNMKTFKINTNVGQLNKRGNVSFKTFLVGFVSGRFGKQILMLNKESMQQQSLYGSTRESWFVFAPLS